MAVVCLKAGSKGTLRILFDRQKGKDRMEYIGNKKKQGGIVELLRDEILAGNIPDGSEMTQNELAESLGVSRMPVREALILLEYQGLIDRLPNNHVRVASFTEAYFHHILKTGAGLEKEFLQNLDEEELKALPEEELNFHRAIWRNYPYSLSRKNLETITEIYLYFVISRRNPEGVWGRKAEKTEEEILLEKSIGNWKSGKKEDGARQLEEDFEKMAVKLEAMHEGK